MHLYNGILFSLKKEILSFLVIWLNLKDAKKHKLGTGI